MGSDWEKRRCVRALVSVLGVCSVLFAGRPTFAQPTAPVEAPRLLSLPDIVIPPGVALPEGGRVEAVITVASAGTATLDDCQAEAEICARVAEAIAGARFEPARHEGTAVAARVRIALRIAQQPTAAESGGAGARQPPIAAGAGAPSAASAGAAGTGGQAGATPQSTAAGTGAQVGTMPQPTAAGTGGQASATLQPSAAGAEAPAAIAAPAAPPAAPEAPLSYGAKARARPVEAGSRRLELAEVRDLPGAFGDPYRAVDALPGVVPLLSGLPYFFIRGSPPAGTLYIYDDIPLPALYHLGVLAAVIHPMMVGPITLYSGVAPARYGRLTGGVIVGDGPPPPDHQTHIEVELRTLDASGYVQTDALGGSVTAAVRYGYPALLLTIFSPQVSLAYWDYQLRYAVDLSPQTRFQLVALGSYDSLGTVDQPQDAIAMTFHRLEPRLIHHVGRDEFGAALLLGWEESALGSAFQLRATRVGPRVWFERKFGERNRLRLSGDMQGILGTFSSIDSSGDVNRNTSDVGLVGNVPSRSLWGVQAELSLHPWSMLELQFGLRGDAWVQAGGTEAVLDPRARAILHPSDALDFHIAAGVVHQPAVFFVPLPGIADLATDKGLQTALQSEIGVGWDTPLRFRAELQLFYHRYSNLVFPDTLLLKDSLDTICSHVDCMGVGVPDRIQGRSYGAEVFLRRPISERLSGFVSYTLAFSHVQDVAGLPYTPIWDVRHVANLVLQWQTESGISAGLRWFVRSGKMTGEYLPSLTQSVLTRVEQRLPWFSRLDLETAYAWLTDWGRMRVALEWFNVTLAREPQDVTCAGLSGMCRTRYLPAIFFPNLSVRGEH